MKPMKKIQALAVWLIRLMLLLFALVYMGGSLQHPDPTSLHFYLALAFVAGSFLVFIGSLANGPTMAVLGGLLVAAVAITKLVLNYHAMLSESNVLMLLMMSIGLFFLSIGNKA